MLPQISALIPSLYMIRYKLSLHRRRCFLRRTGWSLRLCRGRLLCCRCFRRCRNRIFRLWRLRLRCLRLRSSRNRRCRSCNGRTYTVDCLRCHIGIRLQQGFLRLHAVHVDVFPEPLLQPIVRRLFLRPRPRFQRCVHLCDRLARILLRQCLRNVFDGPVCRPCLFSIYRK